MCPGAGLAQQENTPSHLPEATPEAVALPGSPLTAKAGHGFGCWLCHRDRPDWQRMSLLVAGQPPQQWVRQGAEQPPAVFGSQAQPCCTGQRGEFMGHCVRICVLQPQAVTALLLPTAARHLLPQLLASAPSACPAWAGAVHKWDEGPALLERLQALPPLPRRSKAQAGLLTLLHSIQTNQGWSLRGGMGPG